MNTLSATVKGLITGSVMIVLSLLIYMWLKYFDNAFQYVVYAVYVAGIVWAINGVDRSQEGNRSFKIHFSQGFKCFIVVTLMMVLFTWIFLKINPGFQAEMAENLRKELAGSGDRTQREIDAMVATSKDRFTIMLVSSTVFGYLMIGTLVTAIASVVMNRRSTNN